MRELMQISNQSDEFLPRIGDDNQESILQFGSIAQH